MIAMTVPSESDEQSQPVSDGEAELATGRHGSAHIVQVRGDLDGTAAVRVRALIERLLAAHSPEVTTVVVDLTGVAVLAPAGLEALLSVQQAAEDLLDLRIVAATQPVLAPLQATDPSGRFRLYSTLDAALGPDRPETRSST
jgi:anti-anti-sigma factor